MRNNYFTIFFVTVLILVFTRAVSAQTFISKPILGGGFTQACAGESFNTYNVSISFSSDFLASNQFILELSNAEGFFDNPTVLLTSDPGTITTSPTSLTFSLPTDTAGENYKVRVKSTAPAITGSSSDAFPAYYKIQDSPFSINNLIETGTYCPGGSYLLTIDNPGNDTNDSPLQYPSLTFNWFRVIDEVTSEFLFVAKGNSLEVSTPGTYFAETDYGSCSSESFSNRVTITQAGSSGVSTSITSSLGNPYCSEAGPTILKTINATSYQWFRNGSEIEGATGQTYETNEEATYSVNIEFNNCSASASIDLVNTDFTSELNVGETNLLNPGETLTAVVSTTAVNPEFEWYLNETLIAGENQNTFDATQQGNYSVVIKQTQGCVSSQELSFVVTEPFPNVANIPNVITPNGDGINDTWVIPQEFVSGSNAQIMLINSQGKVVFTTNDYQNNWPENQLDFKDINPIYYYIIKTQNQKTKTGSITVLK